MNSYHISWTLVCMALCLLIPTNLTIYYIFNIDLELNPLNEPQILLQTGNISSEPYHL